MGLIWPTFYINIVLLKIEIPYVNINVACIFEVRLNQKLIWFRF